MLENENENADQDVRFVMTKPRRFGARHPIRNSIAALLVVAALGYCGWQYYRIVSSPIDVKNATKAQALSWLALRDLSEESDETQAELFHFYVSKLGGDDLDEISFDANDVPSNLKGAIRSILRGSDKKVAAWDKNRVRPPFARIDYVIRPSSERNSRYATSGDVFPGPSLERSWQERQVAVARGDARASNAERNIQMLVFRWFVDRCERYDATPDEQKKSFLEKTADELESFQRFYDELRETSGLPGSTRVDQLRDFERMNDGWREFAELDQLARVMWFKDLLISTIVFKEAGADDLSTTPPALPTADGGTSGFESAVHGFFNAAKGYFFEEKP